MLDWLSKLFTLNISFPYYDTDLAPFYSRFWATFAHFDGIHYLRLAAHGYADWGSQAFFPLYPLLIRSVSFVTPSPLAAGVIISCLALLTSYLGLRRLFPSRPHLFWLILAFPTAFFFAIVYTESLFFALSIWFFVFLAQNKWWSAALMAALASATRFPGILLAISLLFAMWQAKQLKILPLLLSSAGLLSYMGYLYLYHHDPLLFIHIQPVFGGGRSGGELILLPQVIYRYFRIFVTTSPASFLYFRAALELIVFGWASLMLVRRFRQLSLPVSTYLFLSLLLPTLSGSLSSLPRYALVLTPWLLPTRPHTRILYLLACIPLSVWLLIHFSRGVFVS